MRHLKSGVLQTYLDGELAETERLSVEAHLEGCKICRHKRAFLEKAHADIRAIIEDFSPDYIPVAVPPQIVRGKAWAENRLRFLRWVLAPIRIPAFLLVLFSGMIFVLAGLLYSPPAPREEIASLVIIAENREIPVSLGISLEGFEPIRNPTIFKEMQP
jgi:anti-sigma factor RsiW